MKRKNDLTFSRQVLSPETANHQTSLHTHRILKTHVSVRLISLLISKWVHVHIWVDAPSMEGGSGQIWRPIHLATCVRLISLLQISKSIISEWIHLLWNEAPVRPAAQFISSSFEGIFPSENLIFCTMTRAVKCKINPGLIGCLVRAHCYFWQNDSAGCTVAFLIFESSTCCHTAQAALDAYFFLAVY